KDPVQRLWYGHQATANGWSRSMLEHWIESDVYSRQGEAVTNFSNALPPPQSDLAKEIVRDPYNFDFLTLREPIAEREREEGLLAHIRKFLLELGAGFAAQIRGPLVEAAMSQHRPSIRRNTDIIRA